VKSIHVRELSEATLEGLKKRAARHRRSLQKEVQLLLEQAAKMTSDLPEGSEPPQLKLNQVNSGLKNSAAWERASIYDENGR
jgi:hypothetical protein